MICRISVLYKMSFTLYFHHFSIFALEIFIIWNKSQRNKLVSKFWDYFSIILVNISYVWQATNLPPCRLKLIKKLANPALSKSVTVVSFLRFS